MRRRLPLLCALVSFAGTLAAQSSVWKVTKADRTLYLGGTCHVLRPSDFPLPAEYEVAFSAAEELVFESDIARLKEPATQRLLLQRGIYQDATTLETVLSPVAWSKLTEYCAAAGLPAAQLRQMRPWMATVMIAAIELQKLGVTQEGVDAHFHQRAGTAGKKTSGLETLEEHLGYVTGLGAGQESEMILSTLADLADLPRMFPELIAAWRSGDMTKLDELMLHDMREQYPAVHAELIVKRNNAWLPRLAEMLKTPATEFVLVGAGHLAGDDGLLAALRRRGCTIEQIVVKN